MMFDERRAAQMAAFFLAQQGGRMPLLKLMKLMYLADRESFASYGHPITFDSMVSMTHGPVLSATLNLANGTVESKNEGWEYWVADRSGHDVSLNQGRDASRESLQDLSDADMDIVSAVWKKFGHMGKWEIRDYTHTLPEWQNPGDSSAPIRAEALLVCVGYRKDQALEIAKGLQESKNIDFKLSRV